MRQITSNLWSIMRKIEAKCKKTNDALMKPSVELQTLHKNLTSMIVVYTVSILRKGSKYLG